MPLILLLAFVVVPLVEVAVLLQVGQWIGTGPAVLLLLVDSLVGAWLAKREGTRAWRALRSAMGAGRMPGTEVADGALVLIGATLLLTPGFVTDGVGVLLLLPPSRALVRRSVLSWVVRRSVTVGLGPAAGAAAAASAWRRSGRPPEGGPVGDGDIVDGEVIDHPDDDAPSGGPRRQA